MGGESRLRGKRAIKETESLGLSGLSRVGERERGEWCNRKSSPTKISLELFWAVHTFSDSEHVRYLYNSLPHRSRLISSRHADLPGYKPVSALPICIIPFEADSISIATKTSLPVCYLSPSLVAYLPPLTRRRSPRGPTGPIVCCVTHDETI